MIIHPSRSISSLFIVVASFLFCSCGIQRYYSETGSKDKDNRSFVQTNDGVIMETKEIRLRNPFIGKSTIELDNGEKIPFKEILAYQDKGRYYRNINGQFAPRIKKGLINMYQTSQMVTETDMSNTMMRTRTRTVYYYWLQKGDSARTVAFSNDVVRSYVQDYPPAMEYINVFDEVEKKGKTWAIINTSALVGGLVLAGTQGGKTTNTSLAVGVGGLSLFLGGLINGVVNKIRRGKNYKNLELAIDEYNLQTTKKKKR